MNMRKLFVSAVLIFSPLLIKYNQLSLSVVVWSGNKFISYYFAFLDNLSQIKEKYLHLVRPMPWIVLKKFNYCFHFRWYYWMHSYIYTHWFMITHDSVHWEEIFCLYWDIKFISHDFFLIENQWIFVVPNPFSLIKFF